MQRYFMLIPEASQLVMQAGAIGQGGEIFVLDMGEPVKILDLALELVRRRGLEPGRDIDIEFTGIRPGEKLFEELAADDEQTRPTAHPMIRVWELPKASGQQMKRMLELLGQAASGSRDQILYALSRCVPEYRPDTATSESPDQATNLRLIVAASVATAEAA
jgi:FlaA1/EpsC-like NDP-sugar epimerase